MNIVIRSATLDDIVVIQRIECEADAQFAAAGHPELATGDHIPTQVAKQAILEQRLTAAEVNGDVVGWIYIGRSEGELCVGQLSVSPRFGRRGIGSMLLRTVIDQARANGEPSIVLNTQNDVAWNRPWYERHGFVVVERDQWTAGMETIAADQSQAGLDWSTRVHMQLKLL